MGNKAEKGVGGFIATHGHIISWAVGVACAGAALWVQANFPSRKEWRETTKEMLDKIELIVRTVNESGTQLAIVKDRQDLQTIRIIDIDKRLKTLEIHFPTPLPNPGQ